MKIIVHYKNHSLFLQTWMAAKEWEIEAIETTQEASSQSAFSINKRGRKYLVSDRRLISVGMMPIPGTSENVIFFENFEGNKFFFQF